MTNPYRTKANINLGDVARDKITGFQGTVIARTELLSNCPRFVIQPRKIKDGKPIDCRSFDEMCLEFVERSPHDITPVSRPTTPVTLGDLVEDKLSGLRGVAIGHTVWSNIIVEAIEPKPTPTRTGGPRPEPVR